MIPFLIPLILSFFSIIWFDINNRKGGRIVYFFLYVYLVLLIGLRYKVGGDTINYMGYYEWQDDLDNLEFEFGGMIQPGYSLLCAICKSFSPQFYVFQIIHSLIINTLLFLFITVNTKYKFSAVFCLFFVSYLYLTCEILREALAVTLFAFLYKPLLNKKWIKYYIGVAICIMFHFSALILIFFPFLTWIRFNRPYVLLMTITCIGMFLLSNIFEMLSSVMLIGEKVSVYSSENHGLLADFLFLFRKSLFPLLFALIVKYGCHRKLRCENQLAILVWFGFMSFFNPVIFGRLTNYVILFFILSFSSEIIEMIKSFRIKLVHNALILSLSFLIIYGSGYTMYNIYKLYIPYSSIFNPIEYNRNIFNK